MIAVVVEVEVHYPVAVNFGLDMIVAIVVEIVVEMEVHYPAAVDFC